MSKINRRTHEAVIKIQSVQIVPVTLGGGERTIGQQIDEMLNHNFQDGRTVNKLVLDLCPPREIDPAAME
jgi:hypothetical protein